MQACVRLCGRRIDDVKCIIQSPHVDTRHVYDSLQMHTCMTRTYTLNLDEVHANCKPSKAIKLYECAYILRFILLVIQDVIPAKVFLAVKYKEIRGCVFYRLLLAIVSDKFQCDKLMLIPLMYCMQLRTNRLCLHNLEQNRFMKKLSIMQT